MYFIIRAIRVIRGTYPIRGCPEFVGGSSPKMASDLTGARISDPDSPARSRTRPENRAWPVIAEGSISPGTYLATSLSLLILIPFPAVFEPDALGVNLGHPPEEEDPALRVAVHGDIDQGVGADLSLRIFHRFP